MRRTSGLGVVLVLCACGTEAVPDGGSIADGTSQDGALRDDVPTVPADDEATGDAADPGCDDCDDAGGMDVVLPDASAPDASAPDASAPDATVATDAARPDAMALDATVRDVTVRDVVVVDATTDTGARDVLVVDAASDTGVRDTGTPVPTGPLRVYMATNGSDARDGLSPANAVATLTRVQAIVRAARPLRDVEVRIAPGTYYGQRASWSYTMTDYSITFMPADGGTTRPVFDGCASATGACTAGAWFNVPAESGQATNLHFRYIQVQRYTTAISFNGNRDDVANGWNGYNEIYGCYFSRIGNVFAPSLPYSTAAVRLVNSDHNTIANNHFVDVINTTSGGLIHAIYAAHSSSDNRIANNRFQRSSGDPVRVRDFSNGNEITGNRFIRVGTDAGYTDWYCDHAERTDCTKPTPECPSWNNVFRDNVLDGTWACGTLATFEYFQDDSTPGCARPTATSVRLRTSGNTQTATPCSLD